MGLHVKQNQRRSELQEKLDADLRAKMEAQSKKDLETPDGVSDSAYIEGTKKTTSLAWAWLLIFIAAVAVFIFFIKIVVGA
ncbi:hypothetical protein CR956_00695 [Candidatus Saccharibacteria bacterium]|nr:MAG: hypothetical protein CR956_00695 [Candidatus Saccharibacteria bacterium]